MAHVKSLIRHVPARQTTTAPRPAGIDGPIAGPINETNH
jgi:hypothetical protein